MKEMNKSTSALVTITVFGCAGLASAGIPVFDDPSLTVPCDDAQVDVIWMGSSAGYTGELSWIDPGAQRSPVVLWTNHSAVQGQSFTLPGLFSAGERIDFSYEIIQGQYDFFSTANENDWSQFSVDDSNPLDVIVGIEDIRFPSGDMDHNDAMFRVVFSHPVPTPGTMALIGTGGLIMTRRRR